MGNCRRRSNQGNPALGKLNTRPKLLSHTTSQAPKRQKRQKQTYILLSAYRS
ncbi:Uncharacterised protein [Vibrio cholerae]|nr:Uncharacterised protein [Vibrio cholerae]